jgi:hypothetical protein
MNYSQKYLKYKKKYLILKGGNYLNNYLNTKAIYNFDEPIPENILNSKKDHHIIPGLKEIFILNTWNDFLNLKFTEYGISKIIEELDEFFYIKIPNVIIPNETEISLGYRPLLDIGGSNYDTSENQTRYSVKMTHILFYHFPGPMFQFFSLYYHDCNHPDELYINMIKEYISDKYTKLIVNRKEMGFADDNPKIIEYNKYIQDINSTEFWSTSKYFTARSNLNETKINLYIFLGFYVIYCLNFLSWLLIYFYRKHYKNNFHNVLFLCF